MIELGQIGVGAWGKNLLRTFSHLPDCQVKIFSDLDEKTLNRVGNGYPTVPRTTKYRDVLENEDVEAVIIATGPDSHFQIAREALLADKDVFVEKPMALDVGEGEQLNELASERGRILMVGHIMEYHPATIKLKEFVTSGELGDVHYIYSTRVNLGKVRDVENALWSFAPHDLSIVLYLLEREPIRVIANGMSYIRAGIEDVAFTTVYFDDGVMAHIHVSWLDPHKIRKVTVVGNKKMAVFDDMESAEKIRIYDKGVDYRTNYETYGEYLSLRVGDIVIPSVPSTEPLKAECQHFIDCVKDRSTPRSDGQDGLRVLRILDAAQRSMKGGGAPVALD